MVLAVFWRLRDSTLSSGSTSVATFVPYTLRWIGSADNSDRRRARTRRQYSKQPTIPMRPPPGRRLHSSFPDGLLTCLPENVHSPRASPTFCKAEDGQAYLLGLSHASRFIATSEIRLLSPTFPIRVSSMYRSALIRSCEGPSFSLFARRVALLFTFNAGYSDAVRSPMRRSP